VERVLKCDIHIKPKRSQTSKMTTYRYHCCQSRKCCLQQRCCHNTNTMVVWQESSLFSNVRQEVMCTEYRL